MSLRKCSHKLSRLNYLRSIELTRKCMSPLDPWSLSGRVALVTGAGVGIGQAAATLLARVGATVGIHYHSSREGAEATLQTIRSVGGQAHLLPGDLTSEQDAQRIVDQLVEKTGRLDILFNNAGFFN